MKNKLLKKIVVPLAITLGISSSIFGQNHNSKISIGEHQSEVEPKNIGTNGYINKNYHINTKVDGVYYHFWENLPYADKNYFEVTIPDSTKIPFGVKIPDFIKMNDSLKISYENTEILLGPGKFFRLNSINYNMNGKSIEFNSSGTSNNLEREIFELEQRNIDDIYLPKIEEYNLQKKIQEFREK